VTFPSGGCRLVGVVGLPDEGAVQRGVVLIHGWGGYRIGPNRILVQAARAFNAAGAATLRFDLRGRGDSEGDFAATDLDMMIEDACRAADVLKSESAAERIALLGICSGANVAVGAATLREDIGDLILWSVFPFQPQSRRAARVARTGHFALGYLRKALRPSTWRKLLAGRVHFAMVRRVLFGGGDREAGEGGRNLKDSRRDIMAEFAGYRGRSLFIHGGKDPEGMPAQRLYRAFCREHGLDAEFVTIEGSNHNFHTAAWKAEVIERSVCWLMREQATGGAAESARAASPPGRSHS